MKIVIDISKDRYDEIMAMDWKNCRLIFDEELRAIHDGKVLEQEPCENCISRQQAIDKMQELEEEDIEAYGCSIPEGFDGKRAIEALKALSSVHPKTEVGRWIYDKNIDNWKCSECGETPKTMGYCGSANFMTKHFKYCNHCGCKMQEVKDES